MKPDFDPSRPAVPIAYPRLLVEILNDWGTDRETLLAGTGISPGIFESPENRLTVGAIGDDTLFLGGKWWPVWLVEAA
jgi:hypothetical protein